MAHEVFQHVPFPFPDSSFPPQLGAMVQRTVADGELPALAVVHTADNSWIVLDGVNDPNLDGACVIDAMVHLVDDDPSLAVVARLEVGHRADRQRPGDLWQSLPVELDD
ncbi:hypothetical protein [Actinoplanes sp. M2I2]|uniref:hypothetical protein n=1 Tax=Actinoplanes sp. M2I2 TaxID=1734444 RepID=UPI00201FC443|nr:hypothetical protein [Actinoplanes sp. M2I2]